MPLNHFEPSYQSPEAVLEVIEVTQHAKERYAERIMEMDTTLDIKRYVLQNEEKIKTDLAKMVFYGEIVYTGKQLAESPGKQDVDICITGTWVLILESGTCKVITLYKIDFGVGEDMNKMYIDRYMEKVDEAKEILRDAKKDTEKNIEDYQARISSNERLIKQYRDIIRSLEGENSSYKDLIKSSRCHEFDAETGLRRILSTMIGKPSF